MNQDNPQFPISHVNVVKPSTNEESPVKFPMGKMEVHTQEHNPGAASVDKGGTYYAEADGVTTRAKTYKEAQQSAYNVAQEDRVAPETRAFRTKNINAYAPQNEKKTIKIRSNK